MLLIIARFFRLAYNHLQGFDQGKSTVFVGGKYNFDVLGTLGSSCNLWHTEKLSFKLTSNN